MDVCPIERLGVAMGACLLALPVVAHGEYFPRVAIWLTPVHKVAAKRGIHLVVVLTEGHAPEWDADRTNASEDRVKLLLRHAKAVVLLRDRLDPLVEVDCQSVIDEHR